MDGPRDRPQLELRGVRRRGGVQGAVLVLAGAKLDEMRRASAYAAALADRCLLVAVDGGLRTCLSGRRRPDLFVGDTDSFRKPPRDLASVILSKDVESSDLCGALAELRRRKVQVVVVAGLLGGRLDHEWGNLLELGRWSREFAGFVAPTNRGTVLVTGNGLRLDTVRDRTVSLLALGNSTTVTLRGTCEELARRRLRPGSHGLSNRTGTELDLTVHAGSVAVIFVPHKKRRARPRAD